MKKLFFIFTISLFAACGSGGNSGSSDSASAAPPDTSNAVNPPMPDTAMIKRDTNHVMGDTSNVKRDSMLR